MKAKEDRGTSFPAMTDPNPTAVAIYMTVASVLTVVAVLLAKETARTSLHHDRTLEEVSD